LRTRRDIESQIRICAIREFTDAGSAAPIKTHAGTSQSLAARKLAPSPFVDTDPGVLVQSELDERFGLYATLKTYVNRSPKGWPWQRFI
jgi:hypothetical protein